MLVQDLDDRERCADYGESELLEENVVSLGGAAQVGDALADQWSASGSCAGIR
ncbi:hypothetical protein ABZ801_29760 [Actinomadura sp. NPDC047616]|uniref:hypothetical protein n=1 Tax=Actinomadura sp. NPDC047616 TaxID=3155914 RepID=UPI0033D48480